MEDKKQKKEPPKDTGKRKRKRKAKKQAKKQWTKEQWKKIGKIMLLATLFAVSFGLVLYPYVSNYLFENRADGIIETVEKEAKEKKEDYSADLENARQYNETLANGRITLKDPFDAEQVLIDEQQYEKLLNMTDDGVMGFIKIPCIDVSLPIYHGTSTSVLEKGVGHLHGSSLPIGGKSTHAILTGHTGLSSAKLFTDLTQLAEGDYFFLHIMGEELAYKVDQISVVLPAEIDNLTITPGKDYCTLVTCTPYGVNTHRLLVRGVRTEYKEKEEKQAATQIKTTASKWQEEYTLSLFMAALVFILLILIMLLVREVAKKVRKKGKKTTKTKKRKKRKKRHRKTGTGEDLAG